jgi:5,8-dihydroxy-2-naphthoate synthase
MKLTLGFSPCPNDTFIFDALVNKKIDTEGIDFEYVLEDVETLNNQATAAKLDITKISFNAFFRVLPHYVLLNSGSALGKGCGPLLIARHPVHLSQISACVIAIPGVNTTANMLLSFAFPHALKRVPMLFSEIEDAVLDKKADAGVIIHENRFTYHEKGLMKLVDLGEYWEEKTRCAIPLGGIVIKRNLPPDTQHRVDKLIRKSVEYSYSEYPKLSTFIRQHAQAMDEDIMRKHIDLYVNQYSINLGKEGKKAINILLRQAVKNKMLPEPSESLYI